MKLIAETAWHHDGDYTFFKELVTEIAERTKADFIKFHITLDVDEYMYIDHPGYEWAKERVFSEKQWNNIFDIVALNNKKLMLLFNDKKSIDFGMKYNPELVEIHSVCLNDIKLLQHLKNNINTNTKVVLGVGGTDIYEVENAIEVLETENIVLMHGFQNYPTNYRDVNLFKVKRLMELYPDFKHGYADHTAWDNENNVLITSFGAALGVDYIEKHVSTNTGEGRTDWQAAISIEKFIELENNLNLLSEVKGNGLMKMNSGEKSYSTFGAMKKAAILNKNIEKGEILKIEDIDFKRTVQNSDLSQLDILNKMGATFSSNLQKGHCISRIDLT